MATYNWAEELIDDAIELDGSFRDIELPCMLRYRRGAPTPDTKDVREHVMRAVERGRLVARDAELRHAPDDHVAWSGRRCDVETAREAAFCGVRSQTICGRACTRYRPGSSHSSVS
jgi:hypothetical protein